jgi:hypothetical protein
MTRAGFRLFGLLLAFQVTMQSCTAKPNLRQTDMAPDVQVQPLWGASNGDVHILEEGADNCRWVASSATVMFGDQDTKHQAFAQAVMDARAQAMNRLLGIHLEHQFIDFQQENNLSGAASLTERLLRATQLGRIIKEKIVWAGLIDVEGCRGCRFRADIETCIVPEPEGKDKHFMVHVQMNRASYMDGDETVIAVTSSRDAYLYVYGVDMNLNASLIFPNDYVHDNHIRAGETWTYPNRDLQAKGIYAIARLLPGHSVSAEMVRVVASKTPLPISVVVPDGKNSTDTGLRRIAHVTGEGTFLALMRKLIAADVEWVEDAQAFTIHKR